MKKSELVNWYLKEMESEIETEEELISKKTLFEKVLHRLINYVRYALNQELFYVFVPCMLFCIIEILTLIYSECIVQVKLFQLLQFFTP